MCDLQVASWGAYLLKRDVLAMSFAPRDTHVSQVQFALERGVPAILGIMAENRMPYPARSFDMAHCSRCLIPWAGYGNLLGRWFPPSVYLTCFAISSSTLSADSRHCMLVTYMSTFFSFRTSFSDLRGSSFSLKMQIVFT